MPNIKGTGGADNIDVKNDNGTLNGTPQGTPINNIRGRAGNDTVTVTDSTISGKVLAGSGDDNITVSGSTISGKLSSGSDDDTVSVSGSSIADIRLGHGNDVLDFISTNVSGDVRGGTGTDTLNLPVGTVVTDTTFGTFTVTSGGAYSLSGGTFTLPSGTVVTYTTFENGTGFPCFTRSTLINADHREVSVQHLLVGDSIPTATNGRQRIRWIGSRRFKFEDLEDNPKLRPVRIVAGALGNGLPNRDLLVSRQHRMLVSSKIAKRMFGETDVLVSAIKLTELPGIYVDDDIEEVEYFHLLFDRHEVIFAEGAPSESLYTGPEAMKAVAPEAYEEIIAIFPVLENMEYIPEPARPIPSGQEQKQLISRHAKNQKPLLELLHG